MKKLWVIILYTLREAMARKVFIFFAAITFFVIIGLALIMSFIDTEMLTSNLLQNSGNQILSNAASMLQLAFVTPIAVLGLLLAIFAGANFIPIMLEKGNIDLLLSKPVSRTQLLLGKYFGVLLFVFINIFILVFGVWFIISIKFNQWNPGFLSVALVITFTFAVLYALIVLLNVTTKSSVLGMMVAYLIYLILSPVLGTYYERLRFGFENGIAKTVLDGLYYIIPQTSELMGPVLVAAAGGAALESYRPVIVSFLFIIFMLGFSIFLFNRKDF